MKTILITGINGFLGSNLAKKLNSQFRVIGLESTRSDLSRLAGYSFEVFYAGNNDLEQIFRKYDFDAVIHAATVYGRSNESVQEIIAANVMLPVRLYEFSSINNVRLFLNTDTFFNDPAYSYDYLNAYTLSKKHCVEWLNTVSGQTRMVNMKVFHMYGPGDNQQKFVPGILTELKNNKPVIELTPGFQKRDFIFIDDVVEAYCAVLQSADKIDSSVSEYQVGTGDAVSIRDFVETASAIIGSSSRLAFGALEYREGEIMESVAENDALKALGWRPRYSYMEGLKKTIDPAS